MTQHELVILKDFITQRKELFDNAEYARFEGRHRRMYKFLEFLEPYLTSGNFSKEILNNVGQICKERLHAFNSIPRIDKTEIGHKLYILELSIYGYSCDYFQSV